jgi:outer membrane lipoprotein-sorting protein
MIEIGNTRRNMMSTRFIFIAALVVAMTILSASAQREASQQAVERIQKEVRHEILMLPYFDMFDNITYKVQGYDVTLSGQVMRPTLKTDAERVVKAIEGVEKVDNQMKFCLSRRMMTACGSGRFAQSTAIRLSSAMPYP